MPPRRCREQPGRWGYGQSRLPTPPGLAVTYPGPAVSGVRPYLGADPSTSAAWPGSADDKHGRSLPPQERRHGRQESLRPRCALDRTLPEHFELAVGTVTRWSLGWWQVLEHWPG